MTQRSSPPGFGWLSPSILALLAPLCFAPCHPAGAAPPPNVIFILADDLGSADLGCFGQKLIKTPNIDRLAEQGMRFTQAYAGATVCASLMLLSW